MKARMLYLHALSPIHTGTGRSTDVIDLPVARETVTGWPVLPGSTIKGVLRDACFAAPGADATLVRAAFGPDTEHAGDFAGALTFTDGHLLCLPVRSLAGSFAWVTCPLALRRWRRDHERAGITPVPALPETFSFAVANRPEAAAILARRERTAIGQAGMVYLEDLDLHLTPGDQIGTIAQTIAAAVFPDQTWRGFFGERFGVVDDDLFTFLTETATDVVARVKLLDDTKTVQRGGLWYEEAVPTEAIFAAPVLSPDRTAARTKPSPAPAYDAAKLFAVLEAGLAGMLQIGGGASVGRGLVTMRLGEGAAA